MALSKEVYKEFEDVVGEENICDDPAIEASYAFCYETAIIMLPGNTEEVQAIVRLCNKHKISFIAGSTGWGVGPPKEFPEQDFIYLDLRRMNRIIEINEKQQYAVVEPYVISGQFQAELMKRGLNCGIKGAGSTCTALALSGHGHMALTTSTGDRNTLATEWVTDEGDIVSLGTLGSSDEWFCGDGPGPSLRGILQTGGVITKQAVKVYHWPGPLRFPTAGASPRYVLSEIPPNLMARYFSFPSAEKWLEAELKIGKAEIAYLAMGFNVKMVASNIGTSKEEDFEIFERLSKLVQGPGFVLIIAGNYPEDFEYKKRVLQQIISETGGKSLEWVEEDRDIEAILLSQCIRISASIRETSRNRGVSVGGGMVVQGQRYDLHVRWLEEAAKEKRELIKKGLMVDDGGQQFGWGDEQGHLGHSELFGVWDPTNPESVKAGEAWRNRLIQRALDGFIAVPQMGASIETLGPLASNYHIWEGKVKQAFDPNGVAEFAGFSWVWDPPHWESYPPWRKAKSEPSAVKK